MTATHAAAGAAPPHDRPVLAPLRTAEAWVFDLDNTLYPATADLFAQIDVRMRGYIAAYLGLDPDAAFRLQKDYFHQYGTSLRGLMDLHGMDPGPFLEHVHDIDLSGLAASAELDRALGDLPGRKLIFTNASVGHAQRVIERLGVGEHFEGIFDIAAADHRPKPEPEGYRKLIAAYGIDPRCSVMVEDMARNLLPAAALGMTTVWLRTQSDVGAVGSDGGFIDHTVDALVPFLQQVGAQMGNRRDP
jgi:putative hydrolase of the HAD superfamily